MRALRRTLRSSALLACSWVASACGSPPVVVARPLTAAVAGGPSLRGLAVAPSGEVWASGSQATILRGRAGALERRGLPDVADLDVRDLHVIDARTIVALTSGPGALSRIYRSDDAGERWALVHENRVEEGFYDALEIGADGRGFVLGDPVDGRFVLLQTDDYGRSFREAPSAPAALPGEHAFAASGTCLAVKDGVVWIGTGGAVARALRSDDGGRSWTAREVPLAQGRDSAGVFSLAFADARRGIAVGGDYLDPAQAAGVAAWTDDGGERWHLARRPPGGYRSAVALAPFGSPPAAIAVGPGGVDMSLDAGRTWSPVSRLALHVASWEPDGRAAVAAGADGLVVRLELAERR